MNVCELVANVGTIVPAGRVNPDGIVTQLRMTAAVLAPFAPLISMVNLVIWAAFSIGLFLAYLSLSRGQRQFSVELLRRCGALLREHHASGRDIQVEVAVAKAKAEILVERAKFECERALKYIERQWQLCSAAKQLKLALIAATGDRSDVTMAISDARNDMKTFCLSERYLMD